mmetsp:Transcript_30882/g.83672  ORF Transcript_30882/g.83672 Transcript_30882/m.83672 type:complete len:374 (+) Transcript_30882:235-1356(+)
MGLQGVLLEVGEPDQVVLQRRHLALLRGLVALLCICVRADGRLEALELLGIELLLGGNRLVGAVKVGEDDLEEADDALGALLRALVAALEDLRRKIAHRLPCAVGVGRDVASAPLDEARRLGAVEGLEDLERILDRLLSLAGVPHHASVVLLLVGPQLRRLLQGLEIVGDGLGQGRCLRIELRLLRLLLCDLGGEALHLLSLSVPLRHGGSHLLVAEGLGRGLGACLGLELADKILDDGAHLLEVVLRCPHPQCRHGEHGAVEAAGSLVEEREDPLLPPGPAGGAAVALAAAELQEGWGPAASLQAHKHPVCLPVGRDTRLERLHGLADGGDLLRAGLGTVVPGLGLCLALLRQRAHEGLVSRLGALLGQLLA